MEDNPYQNIDSGNQNPLTLATDPTALKKDKRDPRIILLFILATTIIILSLLAVLMSIIRPPAKPPIRTITPTPILSPIITPNSDNIPTIYIDKFKQIDDAINTKIDFLPPTIDQDIGL